jgi:hypothetical protein
MRLAVKRPRSILISGLLLALLTATSAGAADPPQETRRFNAMDQAAARAVVVKRADLRPASGWRGGAIKPDYVKLNCSNFHPDLSKFVLTGEAANRWIRPDSGLEVTTQTNVVQTSQMAREEWQIQVKAPAAIACIRRTYAATIVAAGGTFVSFKEISFPRIATYAAAFELRGRLPSSHEQIVAEIVLIGRSRTQIGLGVGGPQSARRMVATESLRLARILVGRIEA